MVTFRNVWIRKFCVPRPPRAGVEPLFSVSLWYARGYFVHPAPHGSDMCIQVAATLSSSQISVACATVEVAKSQKGLHCNALTSATIELDAILYTHSHFEKHRPKLQHYDHFEQFFENAALRTCRTLDKPCNVGNIAGIEFINAYFHNLQSSMRLKP